jgi:flagellar biosynthesis/type III secretory pathway protein FliH
MELLPDSEDTELINYQEVERMMARIAELNMEVDNARSDSFAEGYKSGYSDGATFEAELKKRIAELEAQLVELKNSYEAEHLY